MNKMKKNFTIIITLIAIAVLMSACAKKRPVLYPNVTYTAAGETVAQSDIDDCIQLAADHGHAICRCLEGNCCQAIAHEPQLLQESIGARQAGC